MASKQLLRLPSALRASILNSNRAFSVLNRPPPNYEDHVPLNVFEKGALAAGSAVMSLINPRRAGTSYSTLFPFQLIDLTRQISLLPWVKLPRLPTSSIAYAMLCFPIPPAGVSSVTVHVSRRKRCQWKSFG